MAKDSLARPRRLVFVSERLCEKLSELTYEYDDYLRSIGRL